MKLSGSYRRSELEDKYRRMQSGNSPEEIHSSRVGRCKPSDDRSDAVSGSGLESSLGVVSEKKLGDE